MEKRHERKLCYKNFSNDRALGRHMNSHSSILPVSDEIPDRKLVSPTETASSASSDEEDEGEANDQGYGLRENPKKSFRLADPEFSFAGSVVLQDRESETESSKNPTRRRSERIRKCSPVSSDVKKKIKLSESSKIVEESLSCYRVFEPEPGSSSISDATTEEDVAFCLMMLSRDKWKGKKGMKGELKFRPVEDLEADEEDEEEETEERDDEVGEEEEDEEEEEEEETDESEDLRHCKVMANNGSGRSRGKFRCETCTKTFRSYQALGGHRASHKKAQLLAPLAAHQVVAAAPPHRAVKVEPSPAVKVHECPYCSRVFSSGQALGGHKRSHTTGYGAPITVPIPKKKLADTLIDLNLPAPVDDDDLVEISAVSDAEFVYHHASL